MNPLFVQQECYKVLFFFGSIFNQGLQQTMGLLPHVSKADDTNHQKPGLFIHTPGMLAWGDFQTQLPEHPQYISSPSES